MENKSGEKDPNQGKKFPFPHPVNYQVLFEQMLEGFALHEMIYDDSGKAVDYRFLDMNRTFENLTGLNASEVIGKTVKEVIPEIEDSWIETYGRVASTGEPIQFENFTQGLGKHYHVAAYSPARGMFAVLFTDITREVTLRNELMESESRYRGLIEDSGTGVGLFDANGTMVMFNPKALENLEGEAKDFIGKNLRDVFPAESAEEYMRRIRTAIETGKIYEYEDFITSPSGQQKYYQSTYKVLRGVPGRVAQVQVVSQEISRLKNAEKKLIDSEKKYRQIFETTHDVIFQIGLDGRIMDISPSVYEHSGFTREELTGRDAADLYLQTGKDEEMMRIIQEKGIIKNYELELKTKAGKPQWVSMNVFIQSDSEGNPLWLQGSMHNISKLKAANREVSLLNERLNKVVEEVQEKIQERTVQLESSNRELEAFSYSVSHDLRAPLRSIDGYSMILLEEYESVLNEEGKRLLNNIRINAQKMAQLIANLLEFSQLTRSEIQRSSVDMKTMAAGVFGEVSEAFHSPAIDFEIETLPEAFGDAAMIRQIWLNLLSNAVKYSIKKERPRIVIGSQQKNGKTVYFVRDNGVGFDMKYASKLFGVFERLHSASEYPGTGVGLALVQRIVDKHGGSVWAESREGEGSTFYFSI
jgi:PAS domain S-box-containing protein